MTNKQVNLSDEEFNDICNHAGTQAGQRIVDAMALGSSTVECVAIGYACLTKAFWGITNGLYASSKRNITYDEFVDDTLRLIGEQTKDRGFLEIPSHAGD